jgi:hypothetical protein
MKKYGYAPAYPNRAGRAAVWFGINIFILFGVAVTNGVIVFFMAVVSSCLSSAWMITAFLVRPVSRGGGVTPIIKVGLVAIGIVVPFAFTYVRPVYAAIILGVVIHEMRVLNRYEVGAFAAICAPAVSILPLIPTSYSADMQLTFSPEIAPFEPAIGYLVVVVLFVAVNILIKKDDIVLLPLVGKTDRQFGFETVGVPKWILRRYRWLRWR